MYPSSEDKLFGVFVKNFKEEVEAQGVSISESSLIKGKSKFKIKKLLRYLNHYINVLSLYLNGNYDLVYIHYLSHHIPILLIMIIFKKSPIVVNIHGSDIVLIKKTILLKYIVDIIFRNVNLVVSPSIVSKQNLLKSFTKVLESKIHVYPSGGIDSSVFYPVHFESEKILHLGFVSRIITDKGWKVFLKALEKLKINNINFKATFVGKGEDETLLIQSLKKSNLKNTKFIGFLQQDKLVELYNKFDLYIFPTLNDSLGLTGLEAMACGTPVIASNVDGPSTYVKDGVNGYLFNVNDSTHLANKIMDYIQLSEIQKQDLKEKALLTASAYDKSIVTKELMARIKRLIKT